METTKYMAGKLNKIPQQSGVYTFVNRKKGILYIGKATNLKSRVRSYFGLNIGEKRSPLIAKMVEEITNIKFEQTNSVLEALILEATLIKKHQPPYNTAEKDQKSWNYVVITEEDFPRVMLMRERELKVLDLKFKIGKSFGPFPHGGELKEALKIVRKIFPFRDKCLPKTKACFNYQLGLCPGMCAGAINELEYRKTIRHITLFFQGKNKQLISNLKKEMKKLAKQREFEKAEIIKRKIFALEHINDIALIKNTKSEIEETRQCRIEAYDIAHTSGKNIVGVMTVIENGETKKADYRMFKIKDQDNADDTRALKEMLERRFKHTEWPLPNLIVVDGSVAQLNTAQKILDQIQDKITLVAVTKDEKHRPKEIQYLDKEGESALKTFSRQIILANREAHRFGLKFHRKLRDKID